jgi:hypothetical protein
VLDEIAEGQRLGHLGDFDWRFIQRVRLTRDEEKSAEHGPLGGAAPRIAPPAELV